MSYTTLRPNYLMESFQFQRKNNFLDDHVSGLNPTLECHLRPLPREDHHTSLLSQSTVIASTKHA